MVIDSSLGWDDFRKVAGELEVLLARAKATAPDDRQRDLLVILSKLELVCLALPYVSPQSDTAQSPNTYDARRAQVVASFPEFGMYHHIRPSPVSDPEDHVVGDAVDDLADILADIDSAFWEEKTHGRDDGIWQAKFSYEHHLGSHLVDLRSHIYRMRFFGA